MKTALERAIHLGGGITAVDKGTLCFELRLELAGRMTEAGMEEMIDKGEEFVRYMRKKGHVHLDPIYSLLFFTATHLPYIRLTAKGLYNPQKKEWIGTPTSIKEAT